MPETKTKDWVTPVVVVVGAGGIAAGLYLALRKPPGISPGQSVKATFQFDYLGSGGTYVLQVWFGDNFPGQWFIHVFGSSKSVSLPGPDNYQFDLDVPVPLGTKPQRYDAEALVRTPQMGEFEYLIKRVSDGVISVRV